MDVHDGHDDVPHEDVYIPRDGRAVSHDVILVFHVHDEVLALHDADVFFPLSFLLILSSLKITLLYVF